MMSTTTASHIALEINRDGQRVELDIDDETCVIIHDDKDCVLFVSLTLVDQEIMKDDKTMIEQDDKKDNNDCGQ